MRRESARRVALQILDACFAPDEAEAAAPTPDSAAQSTDPAAETGDSRRRSAPSASSADGLQLFQLDAYHRLREIIEHRGGAVLADSVGLGKTHVAVALIRDEVAAGGSALVTAPAPLRAHWMRHLRRLPRCRWVSHTALSRGTRRIAAADLIVVDEAHAFRNPNTRRYVSLALLCERARVLLVTATPVNNSLLDFYHLARLFAPADLFTDIGVPDLLAAVESATRGSGTELRRIADAVMVRRTRRAVMRRQSGASTTPRSHGNSAPARSDGNAAALRSHGNNAAPPIRGNDPAQGSHGSNAALRPHGSSVALPVPRDDAVPESHAGTAVLRFPSTGPIEVVHYDLAAARPDLLERVRHVIPSLTFPANGLYGDAAPRELMRLGLLKRLESSTWALRASVRRHTRVLDQFVAAARDGLLFDVQRGPDADLDGAVQLSLQAIALRPWPPALDRDRLVNEACRDLRALQTLGRTLSQCADHRDPKLERLRALLGTCDERVLLFTEYRETAHGLWRALATRPGIALVHGGDARLGRGRSSRRAVIERFAPAANGARVPRDVERVHLLIATDVLAEGLNLQDAAVVVSYDLPWNPVRLAQRIGRIDRLGSPHQHIRAVAFVPDRGVDELLGLMKRIRRKLRHIRIVGGDAPWSLTGIRATTRLIGEIDAAGDARAHVRALWQGARASDAARGDPTCGQPLVGVLSWHDDRDAALCCFRMGRQTALVLSVKGRTSQVGTAACWTALAAALGGPVSGAPEAPTEGDNVEPAARAAERAARRVLVPKAQANPANRTAQSAAFAGEAVRRWLAGRPGGPSTEEAETADAILRQLGSGARAGTELRLRDLFRAGGPDPGALRSLNRMGPVPDGDTRPVNSDRPTLIGVLLLRATAAVDQ